MNIFELFIVKNLDFFLAVCGMLFVLIFSKRISKKSANLFLLIMGLCLLLTISEYFESYLDFDIPDEEKTGVQKLIDRVKAKI